MLPVFGASSRIVSNRKRSATARQSTLPSTAAASTTSALEGLAPADTYHVPFFRHTAGNQRKISPRPPLSRVATLLPSFFMIMRARISRSYFMVKLFQGTRQRPDKAPTCIRISCHQTGHDIGKPNLPNTLLPTVAPFRN